MKTAALLSVSLGCLVAAGAAWPGETPRVLPGLFSVSFAAAQEPEAPAIEPFAVDVWTSPCPADRADPFS